MTTTIWTMSITNSVDICSKITETEVLNRLFLRQTGQHHYPNNSSAQCQKKGGKEVVVYLFDSLVVSPNTPFSLSSPLFCTLH